MAYFTLHAYDADVFIPSFAGLRQSEEMASDSRYAMEAENVETVRGVLQPMAAQTVLDYSFNAKIETIARFHRRWYAGAGSKDWLVVASDGKLYYMQESGNSWTELKTLSETFASTTNSTTLTSIKIDGKKYKSNFTDANPVPATFTFTRGESSWSANPAEYGVTYTGDPAQGDYITVAYSSSLDSTSFSCNVWSYVTYEINPVGSSSPVDILLLSNAQDGMIMVVPPYTATLSSADWMILNVDTRSDPTVSGSGPKFGVIERYAERIWGGAIPDEPDMLIYSRPYDPTNWTVEEQNWNTPGENEEEPEDVGGSIQQPSWDGDSFTMLKCFGSQLIAFKKHKVWRILGTDPGEYTFKEQYGGGTAYPNTAIVDTERIIMAERDGLSVYDGLAVTPFNRFCIEDLWKTVKSSDEMCAALFKNRYYIAIPTGSSAVNNALIVYNAEENTFLFYKDIYIESMMATDERLYYTSSTIPGKIGIINYDSWESGQSILKATKWVTPWMDFSRKSIAKGGYEIYFNPEVKGGPVTFTFSIQNEKKTKSKNITIQPTTTAAKQKRIRFGGTGRKFRLIVETPVHTGETTWRLVGGIQMVVEIDPD